MKQIKTLEDLHVAVLKNQSVFFPKTIMFSPVTAAFMMNEQGNSLRKIFKQGLFVYEFEEKARV